MVRKPAQSSSAVLFSNVVDLGAELEADIQWRLDEIRNLEKRLLDNDLQKEGEDFDQCRKCLWLMLYAHYEGFFKITLYSYANALNKMEIDCHQANERLVAWSLNSVFNDVEQNASKEPFFAINLPQEASLQRLYRRSKLVAEWRELEKRKVNIPDTAYKTKDNLDYIRLQQLLYQIGLDHHIFESHKNDIALLVVRRHSIAHGDPENRKSGIKGDDYQRVRLSTFQIMSDFLLLIVKALTEKSYEKKIDK